MSKNTATTAATEELKDVATHITEGSAKLVANIKGQENGGIKDNAAKATKDFHSSNLPEGVDEKQAKILLNYIASASNINDHAAMVLGVEHLAANPEAESFTLTTPMFGRDSITSTIHRGTSPETAGMITTDVKHYHVGTNMGQHNLIVSHANRAARDALKFD